eukprot:Opistho-2@9584
MRVLRQLSFLLSLAGIRRTRLSLSGGCASAVVRLLRNCYCSSTGAINALQPFVVMVPQVPQDNLLLRNQHAPAACRRRAHSSHPLRSCCATHPVMVCLRHCPRPACRQIATPTRSTMLHRCVSRGPPCRPRVVEILCRRVRVLGSYESGSEATCPTDRQRPHPMHRATCVACKRAMAPCGLSVVRRGYDQLPIGATTRTLQPLKVTCAVAVGAQVPSITHSARLTTSRHPLNRRRRRLSSSLVLRPTSTVPAQSRTRRDISLKGPRHGRLCHVIGVLWASALVGGIIAVVVSAGAEMIVHALFAVEQSALARTHVVVESNIAVQPFVVGVTQRPPIHPRLVAFARKRSTPVT